MEYTDIPGYEGKYAATRDGRIWSLNYHREHYIGELNGKIDKDGYRQIALRKDNKTKYFHVARLIALIFIPNPDNFPQINHIDGIKTNNVVSNLEWCTSSYNIKHSFEVLGKNQKGSRNNNSRLTEYQVTAIWFLKGIKRQIEIAKTFSVSEDTISMIHRQTTWKWLTDKLK